jgi:hypothetical protein
VRYLPANSSCEQLCRALPHHTTLVQHLWREYAAFCSHVDALYQELSPLPETQFSTKASEYHFSPLLFSIRKRMSPQPGGRQSPHSAAVVASPAAPGGVVSCMDMLRDRRQPPSQQRILAHLSQWIAEYHARAAAAQQP